MWVAMSLAGGVTQDAAYGFIRLGQLTFANNSRVIYISEAHATPQRSSLFSNLSPLLPDTVKMKTGRRGGKRAT